MKMTRFLMPLVLSCAAFACGGDDDDGPDAGADPDAAADIAPDDTAAESVTPPNAEPAAKPPGEQATTR